MGGTQEVRPGLHNGVTPSGTWYTSSCFLFPQKGPRDPHCAWVGKGLTLDLSLTSFSFPEDSPSPFGAPVLSFCHFFPACSLRPHAGHSPGDHRLMLLPSSPKWHSREVAGIWQALCPVSGAGARGPVRCLQAFCSPMRAPGKSVKLLVTPGHEPLARADSATERAAGPDAEC